MKGQSFLKRMGFAAAGIATVFRREKTFRIQCTIGLGVIAFMAVMQPGWVWAALVALTIGVILAAEMFNGALEYLTDRVHPELNDEIKHAKDAAAGAVLLASIAASCVGIAMLLSLFL